MAGKLQRTQKINREWTRINAKTVQPQMDADSQSHWLNTGYQ